MQGLDYEKLRQEYDEKGFVVIPSFVPVSEVTALRSRAAEIVEAVPLTELNTFFFTGEGKLNRETYFLTSGDKIRFFLEEKAEVKDNKLVTPKHLAINKIGHYLHELDPVFKKFTVTPQVVDIAKKVMGFQDPVLCQSMYIMKQPLIGGAVPVHQDSTYLFTTPETVAALWYPIDNAEIGNSCLWVAPGTHKGPLKTRFLRDPTNDKCCHTPPLESITTWPQEDEFIPLPVQQGSVVIFHGRLCHKSDPNTSEKPRHAYSVHLVERSVKWDEENWLQIGKPFPKLEIA